MILSLRRALIVIICVVVILFALLGAIGEVSEAIGNQALWTLGGVARALPVIICFVLLAIAVLLQALHSNNGGGPFIKQ